MPSSSLTTSLVAGQQQSSTQAIGNRTKPRLSLHISENDIRPKHRVSVDLGSPFCGSDFVNNFHLSSSHSRQSRRSGLAPPPGLHTVAETRISAFYDTETESDGSEFDDDAQIIIIPHDSPFYLAPSPPSANCFCSDSMSLACEALSEHDSYNVARRFHEELDRMVPGINDKALAFDAECLRGVEEQLLSSPMEVFQDIFYSDMRRGSMSPVEAPFETLPSIEQHICEKSIPDIPDDVKIDAEDLNMEDCSEDSESDSESYEYGSSDTDSLRSRTPSPRNRLDIRTPLDRRVVAPFERVSSRHSIQPQGRLFCGMFSSR